MYQTLNFRSTEHCDSYLQWSRVSLLGLSMPERKELHGLQQALDLFNEPRISSAYIESCALYTITEK